MNEHMYVATEPRTTLHHEYPVTTLADLRVTLGFGNVSTHPLTLSGSMAAVQPGAAAGGRGNANIPGLQQWIMEIPPVTRAWIVASVAISMAVVSATQAGLKGVGLR